jgi:hypothetical protein
MQLAELLAVAEQAGGIVLTSPIAEGYEDMLERDTGPLQPYAGSSAATDAEEADSFRRGRKTTRRTGSPPSYATLQHIDAGGRVLPERSKDRGSTRFMVAGCGLRVEV